MGCSSSRSTSVADTPAPKKTGPTARVVIVFYSTYGHCYQLAKAAAAGVEAAGGHAEIRRVAEVLPAEVLEKMHALEAQKAFADVPFADPSELGSYDAIILVSSTRYASLAAAMRTFLDATGQLWLQGQLLGKVGSAMVSTATQHGGHERATIPFRNFFLHQGMVVVGLPASFADLGNTEVMNGGSYYGAGTITTATGERMASDVELAGAKFQGKHVAEIAAKLAAK